MPSSITLFRRAALCVAIFIPAQAAAHTAQAGSPDTHGRIAYGVVSTSDAMADLSGGVRRGALVMHNLDLTAGWQGEDGWSAFGYVLGDINGGFSGKYAGDAQVVSNIDATPGLRLFEAYVKKTSADRKASLSVGMINLNGVFDVQDVGALFLNASHGIGPDYSQAGPSIFPISALGAIGEWRFTDHLGVRAGVFDGVPGDAEDDRKFAYVRLAKDEGAHIVAEGEYDFSGGLVKLGHWTATLAAPAIDGSGVRRPQGSYAQLQFTLVKGRTDDTGVHGWLRLGAADGAVLGLDRYAGGGVVMTGLPGRDDDMAGFAIARAHWGAPSRALAGGPVAAETTFEFTYRAAVRPGLSLQPDLQYVVHPGGRHDVGNAVVLALRVKIDFLAN